MIEYVVEHNTDDRVLLRASQILRDGGLVCFPTQTNWKVVADPYSKAGVEKLYRLRHVDNTKHFTVFCLNFQKAMEIAFISDSAFSLMKKVVPGPYTFILEAQKKITKHLKASKHDHEVGISFPSSPLARALLERHGENLIGTHLSPDMFEMQEGIDFIYSALIDEQLGLIDLILDPGEFEFTGPTTIVDFTQGAPHVVRVGSGAPDIFQR